MKKDQKPLILTFFKESYASRTFEVPLKWVYQLGSYLILLSIVTFLTFGLAVRFYFESRKPLSKPQEVASRPAEEKKPPTEPSPITSMASSSSTQSSALASASSSAIAASPIPTSTTPTFTLSNVTILDLAKGLADKTIPQPADIRVELEKIKPRMSEGHLFVDSAIRYVADDGEIQRGYIVILIHTTKDLVAYPNRSLTGKKDNPQIEVSAGEFFAVGRYREIHAEFTSIRNLSEVKKIELLLISNEKKILTLDTWTP